MGKERDLEKACLYQVERDFSLKGGGGTCGREFFFLWRGREASSFDCTSFFTFGFCSRDSYSYHLETFPYLILISSAVPLHGAAEGDEPHVFTFAGRVAMSHFNPLVSGGAR